MHGTGGLIVGGAAGPEVLGMFRPIAICLLTGDGEGRQPARRIPLRMRSLLSIVLRSCRYPSESGVSLLRT